MTKYLAVVCLIASVILCFCGSAFAQSGKDALPLRRVTLYNNGVGYFEREGKVSGGGQVNLSFDSAHLNDVLKSLVVLNRSEDSGSPAGARISAVSFDSTNPIDMRLAELGINLDSTNTAALTVLLGQLKGSRVEVRSGPVPISGTVVGLQRKTGVIGQERIESQELVLVSDAGELRTIPLDQVHGIKLLDPKLRDDLDRYLSILHTASQRNLRTLTISESGQGERNLFVSYLAEAPVWKPTYRLIIADNQKPFIQGWAVVDNTQDEDWNNVTLSLVAGKPVSFIQDLEQPRYKRRPVVGIPEDYSPTPQIHAAAIATPSSEIAEDDDESPSPGAGPAAGFGYTSVGARGSGGMGSIEGVVTDPTGAVVAGARVIARNPQTGAQGTATANSEGRYTIGGLSAGTYSVSVESPGFNISRASVQVAQGAASRRNIVLNVASATETVTVESKSSPLDSIRDVNSGVDTDVSSQEVGELFKYSIDHPVTIKRNSSALIPIVQTNIDGESESLYNAENYPMSAIYLKNTTGLTLEGGPLTVLENNTYAGDALIGLIKPGESRFITYAVDLGCRISTDDNHKDEVAFMTEFLNGAFLIHFHETRQTVYTINNVTDRPKTVVIEHPRDSDEKWKLVGDVQPFEKTENLYRFKVEVAAHSAKEFVVPEELPQTGSYQLSSITPDNVEVFAHLNYLSPEMKQSLDSILDMKARIAGLSKQAAQKQLAITQISEDQARMRENLKALGKSEEERQLVSKYVSKISESDDRLDQLRKEQQQLQDRQNALQTQLDEMIRKLALQRKL